MKNGFLKQNMILNPRIYATLYRYPEGDLMPEKDEVTSAVYKAKSILDFVGVMISQSKERV